MKDPRLDRFVREFPRWNCDEVKALAYRFQGAVWKLSEAHLAYGEALAGDDQERRVETAQAIADRMNELVEAQRAINRALFPLVDLVALGQQLIAEREPEPERVH